MTPVTLPTRTKSQEPVSIEARTGQGRTSGSAGQVTVERDRDRVIVCWTCGARRSFTPEDLQFTLENLELIQPFGDVVFADTDSSGVIFYARILDGRLYVNDSTFGDMEEGDMEDVPHVPWLTFRRTVLRAIGTKDSAEQARKQPEPISEDDWRRQNE